VSRAPATGTVASVARCLLLLAALSGCQGSDHQPLEPVSLDRFAGQDSLVAGGGAASALGYTSPSGSFLPTLRLVRHDAASGEAAQPLGDVTFAGDGRITRLRVTDEAAALVVDGAVRVVDLSDPALSVEGLSVPGAAVDLAVSGRWVAVAIDHGLVLVHRDEPSTPHPFTTTSTPSALLTTGGSFLAFTTTGYVVADTSGVAPTFQEVSDPVLGNLRAAAASGSTALVAGPASSPDRSRVLRLDLTSPAAPVVVHGQEVPGAFVAFASDGDATSVVAIHGEGDTAEPTAFHQGYLLRESSSGFQVAGLPLPFWSLCDQPLAAHAGHLFAVEAVGLGLLRIR
jgi:hypothetical protein